MDKDIIEQEATVLTKISDTSFKVKLLSNHQVLTAYTSGKMQRKYIRVYPGDKVRIQLSPFSLDQGRIVYRNNNKKP